MSEMKLWEAAHPFYAQEGNYYNNDCHYEHESWEAFYEDMGNSDPDMNLVYRWDWNIPNTPDPRDDEGEEMLPETFSVFVVGQRKARLTSHEFPVKREDEPAIRAWLTERAKTITAIWAPINLEGGQQ